MFEDMKFTMCAAPDADLHTTIGWWKLIDELGFDYIGIPDTPLLMREAYVSLTSAAFSTSRAGIKLMVTNPITRDISVTAGAILSMHDLIGDRLVVGFGAGDSSSLAIGLGSASSARIEEYMNALRGLLAGEKVNFQGRELKGAWRDFKPFQPYLMMAGAGEKTFKAAGRCADAVISAFGMRPETIAAAQQWVREGAEEVGRNPDEVEIWHLALVAPGESQEEAFAHASTQGLLLARNGNPRGKLIPEEYEAGMWEMAKYYKLENHSRLNTAIVEIAKRTGCLEYLCERAGMVGPVDYTKMIERYRSMGVKNMILNALGPDRPRTCRALAEQVISKRQELVA